MDYNEFSAKIKAKYPQYGDMDNLTLAKNIVSKHPEYSDVTFDKPGGLWKALTTQDLDSASKYDPLAQGARLGQFANSGNQQMASGLAEIGGRAGAAVQRAIPGKFGEAAGNYVTDSAVIPAAALGTASEFLMPTSRLGVGAVALSEVGKGLKYLKKLPGAVNEVLEGFGKESAPATEAAADYSRPPSARYQNGVLNTQLKEQMLRNEATSAGEDLARSQKESMQERASALPNMRDLNSQKSELSSLISSKQSEIEKFTEGAGNRNLTDPEQSQLKVLRRQLVDLRNKQSKLSKSLSSAASAPGIRPMAPSQVPESLQAGVSEAEKASEKAQAEVYARLHPPTPDNIAAPELKPDQAAKAAEQGADVADHPVGDQYRQPSKLQRGVAKALSVQSGVSDRHLAAVIANPEIMSDATPSTAEVGKKYKVAFDRLGIQFNAPLYQEVTGYRYKPSETQVARLSSIVQDTMTKLEADPNSITPAEAFIARSAGATAMRNTGIADVNAIRKDVEVLDRYLENNGVPEIRELSREYFKASAKEALEKVLPMTKREQPAVVRSAIMAKYLSDAAAAVGEGHYLKGMVRAATGSAMSPFVQGKAIPFLLGESSPALKKSAPFLVSPALKALQRSRDQENGQ